MGGRVSGLAGLAITVALLVAVAVIGGTLSRVQGQPELSGGWWDGFVGVWDERAAAGLEEALASTPEVVHRARAGWLGESELAGRPLGMMFIDPEGDVGPVMSRGRAPVGPHEVALGPATLAADWSRRRRRRDAGDPARGRPDDEHGRAGGGRDRDGRTALVHHGPR